MAIVLPHTFHDGTNETASGQQVMDNLNALKTAVEALELREARPTQYFTTSGNAFTGQTVNGSEHSVTTVANQLVSYRGGPIIVSWLAGEGREGGCFVRLVRNGSIVLTNDFKTGKNGAGGGHDLIIPTLDYVQAAAGTNTWRVDMEAYGGPGSLETIPTSSGILSFI